jgi:hypothetical protein
VLTCRVVGCLDTIDETVCGSGYCAEHEHHPVGKASFEVMRQVLIDIRESTGYEGWTKHKEGWDMLETYTTMEELEEEWNGGLDYDGSARYAGRNHDGDDKLTGGACGVTVKDGKLVKITLRECNLTGTPPPQSSLGAHSSPHKYTHMAARAN